MAAPDQPPTEPQPISGFMPKWKQPDGTFVTLAQLCDELPEFMVGPNDDYTEEPTTPTHPCA